MIFTAKKNNLRHKSCVSVFEHTTVVAAFKKWFKILTDFPEGWQIPLAHAAPHNPSWVHVWDLRASVQAERQAEGAHETHAFQREAGAVAVCKATTQPETK